MVLQSSPINIWGKLVERFMSCVSWERCENVASSELVLSCHWRKKKLKETVGWKSEILLKIQKLLVTWKPSNTETDQIDFWGISRNSLKSSELLRDFRIFFSRFYIFIVEWFPLFSGRFPHSFWSISTYFWSVAAFSIAFKILICCSVSSNFV